MNNAPITRAIAGKQPALIEGPQQSLTPSRGCNRSTHSMGGSRTWLSRGDRRARRQRFPLKVGNKSADFIVWNRAILLSCLRPPAAHRKHADTRFLATLVPRKRVRLMGLTPKTHFIKPLPRLFCLAWWLSRFFGRRYNCHQRYKDTQKLRLQPGVNGWATAPPQGAPQPPATSSGAGNLPTTIYFNGLTYTP